MQLNKKQQIVVEQNMGLVGKVIKDKVHGLGQNNVYSYENLFQIGCIGLCKAAATDKGGCFSTYAYRLIWNEICDALISGSRISKYESSSDELLQPLAYFREQEQQLLDQQNMQIMMQEIRKRAKGVTLKGIECLEIQANGYTSQEIGRMHHVSAATVRMWMTKARCFLRQQPELVDENAKEVI